MDQNQLQVIQQQTRELYHTFVRKRTENWCRQDTLQLIHLWKNNVRDLKGIKRNYHVYQKLAEELSRFGVKRSPREVKTKIANLAADYRKEQCKIRMGAAKSSWKFWKEVDEVFTLLHKYEGDRSFEIPFTTPPNSEHSITIVPLLSSTNEVTIKPAKATPCQSSSTDSCPVLSISDVRSVVDDDTINDDDDDNDSLKILNENSSSYDNSTVSNLAHSILSPPGTSDTDNREAATPVKRRPHSPDQQTKILKMILEEQRRSNEQFMQASERTHKLHLQEIELQKQNLAVQQRIAVCMEKLTGLQRRKSNSNFNNVKIENDSSNDALQIDECDDHIPRN